MKTIHTLDKYKAIIEKYNPNDFNVDAQSKSELIIQETPDKRIRTYYAPFDHVNKEAKLIVVGITPGRTQMNNALRAACQSFHSGESTDQALYIAKKSASFSGGMRNVLIKMLDKYGFNQDLALSSCNELWDSKNHLVHFTSALRNPVFCCKNDSEENYTGGSPNLVSYKGFKETLMELKIELLSIESALVIPLGDKVAKAIQLLVDDGSLPLNKVLNAEGKVAELAHPSGANGESHGLLLADNMVTKEEYTRIKLADYIVDKEMKNERVTSDQQRRYINVRGSYWERARHTRIALSNM